MLKFKNLVVFFAFVLTMFGFSIDINEVRLNQELSCTKAPVVTVVDDTSSTFEISFASKKAEAIHRLLNKLEDAGERIVNRSSDSIVYYPERNIQRRIDDHIRDQAELLDPNSRTYQEYKCKKILNALPYGRTRILVQGSIDALNAPGCVFIEERTVHLLERMIREYSNVVIENDCYKKGRNGRRGDWIGFDILKVANANDIIVTE